MRPRLPGGVHYRLLRYDARVNLNLMARSPSAAHHVNDLSDPQLAARERVARAIDALGGHGSPARSCVWHVVGMQNRFANGRCARAGAVGRCGRRARREFSLLPSACSQSTSASASPASGAVLEVNGCSGLTHSRVASMACKQNARAICFRIDRWPMQVLASITVPNAPETKTTTDASTFAGPP